MICSITRHCHGRSKIIARDCERKDAAEYLKEIMAVCSRAYFTHRGNKLHVPGGAVYVISEKKEN